MATAYRRMIFVGLGGSGGKTLRFLKRDINRWFDEIGWENDMPVGWQFLQIDTPTIQDGASLTAAPMLPDSEYLGLINRGTTFDQVDESILAETGNHLEYASWRVNPNALNVPIHTGAGMYRAVGRTIATAYLKSIRTRLVKTFDNLSQANSQASLTELYEFVHGEQPSANDADPIVVVISSLAGGTGAGLINDVCDLLRELNPSAGDASFGLLFTPEVFESVVPKDGGILPNGLAAVSEIMNGYWWHGNAGNGTSKIKQKNSKVMRNAGAISPYKRTGPAFPFLIGSRNSSGISYSSDEQLFEVVGAALTSWTTDVKVQSELLGYTFANWSARAAHATIRNHNALLNQGDPNNNEPALNPFSALGFARVSVGNRYFASYASERIARDAFQFLRDNHVSGGVALTLRKIQPNITPQELIQKQSDDQFNVFLNRCKLNEKGQTNNQVEDALKPTESEWHSLFYECQNLAGSFISLEGNQVASVWVQDIRPAVVNAAEHFDALCQPIIENNVRRWIKDQPAAVLNVVVQNLGEHGLSITSALVDKLIKEILDPIEGITRDLKNEIEEFTRFIDPGSWEGKALAQFSQPTRKVPRGKVVDEAIAEALSDAVCATWIRVKKVSIELLEAFANGFLQPLAGMLQSAVYQVDNDKSSVAEWPTWPKGNERGSLSPNSTPPLSEYTILTPPEYEALFNQLLEKTIGGNSLMSEEHQRAVRTDVLSGNFLDEITSEVPSEAKKIAQLRTINLTSNWNPGLTIDANDHTGPRSATFEFKVAAEDLLSRSKVWLNKPGNAFKELLDADLRTFTEPSVTMAAVAGSDQIYAQRRTAFLTAFESAINASKPLISLDTQLMAVLLGNDHPKLAVEVSTVPFLQHPLEANVKNRLQIELNKLPQPKSADDYFSSLSRVKHIDIVTSLYGAYPVLVLQSLLEPIAQAWSTIATSDVGVREFWNKRRGRRLEEFIPAPQEHIRCMIRGWFLGLYLGLIDTTGGKDKGWSVVSRMASQPADAQELPEKLLSTSAKFGDNIARVLESLGLAYIQVGVQNNLRPLGGYVNLLDLGRADDGSDAGLNSYGTVSDYVSHWVHTGDLPKRVKPDQRIMTQLLPHRVSGVTGTASSLQRREALRGELVKLKGEYEKELMSYSDQLDQSTNVLSSPPLWVSMKDLIYSALDQLVDAIGLIDIKDDDSGDKENKYEGDFPA